MAETTDKEIRRYQQAGALAIVLGIVVAVVGALIAHFTGLPETDSLGRDLYPSIPRGWGPVLVGQLISLGGTFVLLGGITVAFLYKRRMTWARSAIGRTLHQFHRHWAVAVRKPRSGGIPPGWKSRVPSSPTRPST